MNKFEFGIVLIADRTFCSDDSFDISGDRLEQIGDGYFYFLLNGLSQLSSEVTHYNSLSEFIDNIQKHKNDVIFTVYGGNNSRNRMALVPAICESYGIKFIGADTYARIICQDKQISKQLIKSFGLKTPQSVLIRSTNQIEMISSLNFPVVVKPNLEGSSIGINKFSLCHKYVNAMELSTELLSKFHQPILVEEFVEGREVVCCLVGNESKLIVQEFMEVYSIKQDDYFIKNLYTAENKHLDGKTFKHRIITSQIEPQTISKVLELFRALGKMDFMRIDGRLNDSGFHVIELTPDAYIGKGCSVLDVFLNQNRTYAELLYEIVNIALDYYHTPCPNYN